MHNGIGGISSINASRSFTHGEVSSGTPGILEQVISGNNVFMLACCVFLLLIIAGVRFARGRITVHERVTRIGFVLVLALLNIVLSAALATFNKYLVAGDFPYPIHLGMIQMGHSSILLPCVYLVMPSLFPTFSSAETKVHVNCKLIGKVVLPIAVFFAGQVYLSNLAYMSAGLAFLQMVKGSNVVSCYFFSWLTSIEKCEASKTYVVIFILMSTFLTVSGSFDFPVFGFMAQFASCLIGSAKVTLQGVLFMNDENKIDGLTSTMLLSPLCFIILAVLLCVLSYAGVEPTVPLATITAVWLPLLGNASLALALNVTMAFFVKHSSAMAYTLTMLLKDSMIVLVGARMFHEDLSKLQMLGYTLQLLGIGMWSLMKLFPHKFESCTWYPCGQVPEYISPKLSKGKKTKPSLYLSPAGAGSSLALSLQGSMAYNEPEDRTSMCRTPSALGVATLAATEPDSPASRIFDALEGIDGLKSLSPWSTAVAKSASPAKRSSRRSMTYAGWGMDGADVCCLSMLGTASSKPPRRSRNGRRQSFTPFDNEPLLRTTAEEEITVPV